MKRAEHGFTLVEMLIALTIFAMLTAAGVAGTWLPRPAMMAAWATST